LKNAGEIVIRFNKLSAVHPKAFSNMDLYHLDLSSNICVDKSFFKESKANIEEGLATCGAEYAKKFGGQ
jgi:hypothetical protein